MPELDTIRGIAVLAVLFLHGFFWRYDGMGFTGLPKLFLDLTRPGWLGVNLFFVLSGFLITGILVDSKPRPHYYRRFYVRRALRILPAYYSLLIALALLRSSSLSFVGLSFVYLSNVVNFFGVANDYGPLWSLAVEEHYYLLWPAVVRRLSLKNIAAFSTGIFLIVPVLRAVSFQLGWTTGLASYTWFVADGLAAGSIVAVLLRGSIPRTRVRTLCAALLCGGAAAAMIGRPFGILTEKTLLGAALQHTVVHAIFAGILLLLLLLGTSSRRKYVNIRILQFFGYISYGLYLVHLLAFRMYDKLCRAYWPELIPSVGHFNLVVTRFLIAGAGAIAVAYLSRRYFEERFLQLKDRLVPGG